MSPFIFTPRDPELDTAVGSVVSHSARSHEVSRNATFVSACTDVQQELDRVIAELGRRSVKAYENGDPTGARIFLDRQMLAIASRTPEHKAALTAEIDRAIDEGVNYFDWQGRLDAEILKGRVG
jgi:hypothetical protein